MNLAAYLIQELCIRVCQFRASTLSDVIDDSRFEVVSDAITFPQGILLVQMLEKL